MDNATRRSFIASSGKLLAGTAALGLTTAYAADEQSHHGGPGDGIVNDATAEMTCVTCQFWGGMRKVSIDKKQVLSQSMGWCNNPASPNHQKLTEAGHQMTKTGVWQKWAVL